MLWLRGWPELLNRDTNVSVESHQLNIIPRRRNGLVAPPTTGGNCAGDFAGVPVVWDILPDELSAAGLMVPEPSVTPRPFVACAEYISTGGGGVQRRGAR